MTHAGDFLVGLVTLAGEQNHITRIRLPHGVRDVILLAGKGHEPYQEIAGVRHPYSDLEAAKSALEARR